MPVRFGQHKNPVHLIRVGLAALGGFEALPCRYGSPWIHRYRCPRIHCG